MRAALHHFRLFHSVYVANNRPVITFIDGGVYIMGTFGACMTVPQILRIFMTESAAGVSLYSWLGFLAAALFWFAYGFAHKAKPILFINTLWIIFDLLVILGIVMYR